jgi:plastocyanin
MGSPEDNRRKGGRSIRAPSVTDDSSKESQPAVLGSIVSNHVTKTMTKLLKILAITAILAAMAAPVPSASLPSSKESTGPAKPQTPERTIVEVSNYKFEPKEVTVKVGTVVRWLNKEGWHTIHADNGSFKSTELKGQNAYYDHEFTKAGRYPYHCFFHGNKGGKDMAGTVIVQK